MVQDNVAGPIENCHTEAGLQRGRTAEQLQSDATGDVRLELPQQHHFDLSGRGQFTETCRSVVADSG